MEGTAGIASTFRDGWLVWEAAGMPVSVRLNRDVVSRLGISVREGFKAIPRRGLETGGLLIGRRREAGNLTVVEVNDFEPIESEHAAGPSYLLSAADRRLLEARIAAREKAGGSGSVVGFYRSDTRRSFAITTEDAFVFSTYFPKASDVFLLIKRNETGPPTGGFIIREGGKVVSDTPYALFPLEASFEPGVCAAAEPRVCAAAEPGVSAVTAPQAEAVRPDPRPAPEVSPTPSRRFKWELRWPVWLAASAVIALAVGLPPGIEKRIAPPVKRGRSLALNVTSTGKSLRLSWDHSAVEQAGGALLWIKDGPEERRFELDAFQLSEGSVAYWPRSGDVTFRLELPQGGSRVSESVRAIGATSDAVVAASKVSPFAPPAAPAAPAAATTGESGATPVSEAPARGRVTEREPPPPVRAFTPPHAAPAPAPQVAALPDPPMVPPGRALPPPHVAGILHSPAPVNSSVQVQVEPVPSSRLDHLARNIPLIGRRFRREDYVPPVPITDPARVHLPHREVAHEIAIDVKVHVTASGKVDYSEIVSKVPDGDLDLATLAMFSARRWEFAPANAGGRSVAGEAILRYRFAPADRTAERPALATR